MSIHEPITITKLEAARRQLETAITLYFNDGDLVSIHTLACAAHEIIQNINRGKGGNPTLRETWREDIKPEWVKIFSKRLNHARNFFKHSGRDEHESASLASFASDIVMLDACWTYHRMTGERPAVFAAFELWAAITWGAEFISYEGLDISTPPASELARLSRQEYLRQALPAAHAAIAGASA